MFSDQGIAKIFFTYISFNRVIGTQFLPWFTVPTPITAGVGFPVIARGGETGAFPGEKGGGVYTLLYCDGIRICLREIWIFMKKGLKLFEYEGLICGVPKSGGVFESDVLKGI